tara:strand:- start:2477 stop:2815 length:339 start_codon:yes stop_codon:yes gene_type:complete
MSFLDDFGYQDEDRSHNDLARDIINGKYPSHQVDCPFSSLLQWIDFVVTDKENLLCNMVVKFKDSGREYMYHDVHIAKVLAIQVMGQYEEFSVGRLFNDEIKNQHNYTELVI